MKSLGLNSPSSEKKRKCLFIEVVVRVAEGGMHEAKRGKEL